MASVVSEKFCYLILLKHLPAPDFPPSRLIIVVSGTVTANAAAWFLLCKLTILSLLLTGQENSPPLMRSVLACGEHHLGDATYLVRRSETRESNVLSASWLLQTVKR
ncbi:hydrolase, alpha/beta fold family protein [Klebsiella pneumoniae]|nr:hydrolase, alpha/beta fold family protein [Klebsiella pneumoniae]